MVSPTHEAQAGWKPHALSSTIQNMITCGKHLGHACMSYCMSGEEISKGAGLFGEETLPVTPHLYNLSQHHVCILLITFTHFYIRKELSRHQFADCYDTQQTSNYSKRRYKRQSTLNLVDLFLVNWWPNNRHYHSLAELPLCNQC